MSYDLPLEGTRRHLFLSLNLRDYQNSKLAAPPNPHLVFDQFTHIDVVVQGARPPAPEGANVVVSPRSRIAEHFVRRGDLVEPPEGLVIVRRVHVGVELLGELVECGL